MAEKKTQHKVVTLPRPSNVKLTKGIQVETVLRVADNCGAVKVKVIGVRGVGGRLNRIPRAGSGDVIVCSVIKGSPDLRRKVVFAVLLTQKKIIKRKDGINITFEENTCCLIDNKGDVKGSIISGPVPKEVAILWPKVASAAASVY